MKIYLLKNENSPVDYYRQVLLQQYEPHFIPLLTHSLHINSTIEFLNHEISKFHVIIVTSQRAVECLQQCLESPKMSEQVRNFTLLLPVYTVGPSTSQYLTNIGFKHVYGKESGNGHRLSELIVASVDKSCKIIYFTGEIRKDIIPGNLRAQQMSFEEVVVYSTQELNHVDPHQLIQTDCTDVDWVVFFSSQGTKGIVETIKRVQQQRPVKVGVIGPTTNQYLLENDIDVTFVCESPTADNLLKQLNHHT